MHSPILNTISLITYSIASDKGFLLNRLTLPSSVQYIMNMQYDKDIAIILDFENIYIISIDDYGNSYVVETLNEIEAGGLVCWA